MTATASIESLWRYPISGGPGVSAAEMAVNAAGIVGDRMFVIAEREHDGTLRRVGSKEAAEDLFKMNYTDSTARSVALGASVLELPEIDPNDGRLADTYLNEFDTATPVILAGKEYDEAFSDYLGRPVKLLQKTSAWLLGYDVSTVPYQRGVAPLHLISMGTIARLRDQNQASSVDKRRFRPNIVVDGLAADEELEMVGSRVEFISNGESSFVVFDRGTPRCPVPSKDPDSGENLNDVSLRSMQKTPNRNGKSVASAGVYGHVQDGRGLLRVGAIMSIDDSPANIS